MGPATTAARGPKSKPFSMRLSRVTDRFVTAEARRTKRSRGAVVEALAEEAARMRRFPGIAFRGEDAGRRAWVIGTGLDVWEVIEMLGDHRTSERLVAGTELDARAVDLARAYHATYPEEIDGAMAENRRSLAELRELYPFIGITPASPRR